MKITFEFDSWEEFQKHTTVKSVAGFPTKELSIILATEKAEEMPEKAEEMPKKAKEMPEKAKEMPEKPAEKPQEAPAEEKTEDSAPFEEKPKIDESYRLEVRKELAALNKLQTGNPAKALIVETGYKRLTDVPLDLLPGLMARAKEAMNNV